MFTLLLATQLILFNQTNLYINCLYASLVRGGHWPPITDMGLGPSVQSRREAEKQRGRVARRPSNLGHVTQFKLALY